MNDNMKRKYVCPSVKTQIIVSQTHILIDSIEIVETSHDNDDALGKGNCYDDFDRAGSPKTIWEDFDQVSTQNNIWK